MQFGTEILTTARMRAIESAAMASGRVTGLQLMQCAARAVAGQIRLRWPKPGRAVVLCGPGNNGGDGYAIARLLHGAGWCVRVLGLEGRPGPDAAEMKRLWREIGPIEPLTEASLRRAPDSHVYVDAIFGTGLTRPPEGEIAGLLAHIGGRGGDGGYYRDRLVAVDCPSGLCMDSGVMLGSPPEGGEFDPHAGLTIAFDSPKPGHLLQRGPILCGELVIADIGLAPWRVHNLDEGGLPASSSRRPAAIQAIWPRFPIPDSRRDPSSEGRQALWLRKQQAGSGHKFSHGHALVLAGGPGQGGAARLSARAALRVGAGLVTLCPHGDALAEHAGPPDALMRRAVEGADDLRSMLRDRRITALCLGPGSGIARAGVLLPVALSSGRACVLDADALTALSQAPDLAGALHENCVLTPHGGEFARLFPNIAARLRAPEPPPAPVGPGDGQQMQARLAQYREALAGMRGPAFSRLDAAREAAARLGAVLVLKGPDTVIAAPDGRALIHSDFDIPWLATAGAGDVLAGLIAGLLARGLPALPAAALAVRLHGAAARRFGPGLIADDLPDQIPALLAARKG